MNWIKLAKLQDGDTEAELQRAAPSLIKSTCHVVAVSAAEFSEGERTEKSSQGL